MFCRNCGKEISDKAVVCPACGVPPLVENKFCNNCGAETTPSQTMCTKCGAALPQAGSEEKNKMVAGLLAIFLGALGIHKFYLGYSKEGVIMLVATIGGGIVTCGIASCVISVIALIEGIIYLTKTDQEFQTTYVLGRKAWF